MFSMSFLLSTTLTVLFFLFVVLPAISASRVQQHVIPAVHHSHSVVVLPISAVSNSMSTACHSCCPPLSQGCCSSYFSRVQCSACHSCCPPLSQCCSSYFSRVNSMSFLLCPFQPCPTACNCCCPPLSQCCCSSYFSRVQHHVIPAVHHSHSVVVLPISAMSNSMSFLLSTTLTVLLFFFQPISAVSNVQHVIPAVHHSHSVVVLSISAVCPTACNSCCPPLSQGCCSSYFSRVQCSACHSCCLPLSQCCSSYFSRVQQHVIPAIHHSHSVVVLPISAIPAVQQHVQLSFLLSTTLTVLFTVLLFFLFQPCPTCSACHSCCPPLSQCCSSYFSSSYFSHVQQHVIPAVHHSHSVVVLPISAVSNIMSFLLSTTLTVLLFFLFQPCPQCCCSSYFSRVQQHVIPAVHHSHRVVVLPISAVSNVQHVIPAVYHSHSVVLPICVQQHVIPAIHHSHSVVVFLFQPCPMFMSFLLSTTLTVLLFFLFQPCPTACHSCCPPLSQCCCSSYFSRVQHHVIPAVHHSHSVIVLSYFSRVQQHVIPAVHHSHSVVVLPISAVSNIMSFLLSTTLTVLLFFLFQPCPTACHSCCPPLSQCCCSSYFSRVQHHVIPAVHHSHSVIVLSISAVSNSMSFLLSTTLTVLLFFLFQPCPTSCHSCCPPLSQCYCSFYFSRVQQHVIPAVHHSHSVVVLPISAVSNIMSFLLSTTLTVLLFFLFQPCPTACHSCCPPLSQCCSSYFSRVQHHVIPAVHHSHSVIVLSISAVSNIMSFLLSTTLMVLLFFLFQPCPTACHSCCPPLSQCCCSFYFSRVQQHVIPAIHHSHSVIVLSISAVSNVQHVIPAVHHSHSVVLPISAVSNSMSFLLSTTLTVLLFFLFQPCPTACHSCCPPLSRCCCSFYFSRVQQHVIPAVHHSHSVIVLSISAVSNSMSFLLSTTLTVLLFFLFQPCPTACHSCCPPLTVLFFLFQPCPTACHSCCPPLSQCYCSFYFSRVQQHVIPAVHHSHSVVVLPISAVSNSMSFLLSTTLTVLLFFLFQPCPTACHSCCPPLSQCCFFYFSRVQQHVIPAVHHSHSVVLSISAVSNSMSFLLSPTLKVLLFFLFQPCPTACHSCCPPLTVLFFLFQPCPTACHSCCPPLSQCCSFYFSRVQQHVIPAVHHSHSVIVLPISAMSNSMSFLLSTTLTVLLFFLFQPCPTACHSCCPPLSQCCCFSYFSHVQQHIIPAVHHSHSVVLSISAVSNSMSFLLSTTLTVLLFFLFQPCPTACHSCCPPLSQCCCSSYFSHVQQHVIPAVHTHSVVLSISAVSNSMSFLLSTLTVLFFLFQPCPSACHSCCPPLSQCCSFYFSRVQQHVIPAIHHSHSVIVLPISAVSNSMSFLLSTTLTVLLFFLFQPCPTACHSCYPPLSQCCSFYFSRVQQHVIPAVHHSHSVIVLPISAVSNSMSFLLSTTLTVLLFFLFQPCPTACHSCYPPLSQCCSFYFSRVQQHVIPAVQQHVTLSTTLTVLLFAGMQLYQSQLASKEWMTILGGFLGSILFILIITVSFTGQQQLITYFYNLS